MAGVELVNVRKAYGDLEVIHGINLSIADKEFVVLVGPSGCGKSTLLRMIAGLETITGGEIKIGEEVVNDFHPKDRNIAMVFQNYALYAHMTVYDNIAFSMQLKKMPKDVIDAAVMKAAKTLNLMDYLKRYPRELSGGQRQRVAMGRAIVREPTVFLFDEPLSNLDAKLRVQMRTEIRELQQRLKTTTVYVTHDQIEAMTMADKIVVMNGGHIEQAGAPLELYDHPVNTFVAGFIGSPAMNLIEGTVASVNGERVVAVAGGSHLPCPPHAKAEMGQPVLLGVRPEGFLRAEGGHTAPLHVTVVEPTGPEVQVFGHLGSKPTVEISSSREVCALFRDRAKVAPGDVIALTIDAPRTHLFDPKSGKVM
jgi:multiple sugar transport system ATP-binding protein